MLLNQRMHLQNALLLLDFFLRSVYCSAYISLSINIYICLHIYIHTHVDVHVCIGKPYIFSILLDPRRCCSQLSVSELLQRDVCFCIRSDRKWDQPAHIWYPLNSQKITTTIMRRYFSQNIRHRKLKVSQKRAHIQLISSKAKYYVPFPGFQFCK